VKLSECQMCGLCKNRVHTSFSKGQKPASVFILFGTEPSKEVHQLELLEFIRQLNYELKHDYYYSFAIKCFCPNIKFTIDQVQKCNKWLLREIELVNPYLIVSMGKIATISLFGEKYLKFLTQNVFYIKDYFEKKRQIFIGETITGDRNKLIANLNKLRSFIKEYYG